MKRLLAIVLWIVICLSIGFGIANSQMVCGKICEKCKTAKMTLIGTIPVYAVVSTGYTTCPDENGMTVVNALLYKCVNGHLDFCYGGTFKSNQSVDSVYPECKD